MEAHCVSYKVRTYSVASTNAYSLSAKPTRIAVELTNEIQNLTLIEGPPKNVCTL
jgi:hypothetical protein